MDEKALNMYKSMVRRNKHKLISREEYDSYHNYNIECNSIDRERE